MITFSTISGSIYQVDEENKRIRRITGKTPPHRTFAPDGKWKPFEEITFIEVGLSACIKWPEAVGGSTITSVVREIRGQRAA